MRRTATYSSADLPSLFDFENTRQSEPVPDKTEEKAKTCAAAGMKTETARQSKTHTSEIPDNKVKPKPSHKKAAPAKPELPSCLKTLTGRIPLAALMQAANLNFVQYEREYGGHPYYSPTNSRRNAYYTSDGRHFLEGTKVTTEVSDTLLLTRYGERKRRLLHLTADGTCWTCDATFPEKPSSESVVLTKWKPCERLSELRHKFICQTEPVKDILERTNPYLLKFADSNRYNLDVLIQAPHLETLSKAGFTFADSILRKLSRLTGGNPDIEAFNRLCRPGSNPKDIFKTSKAVYTTLKHCENLDTWDIYRKLDKFGRIRQDAIQQAYNNNYGKKELEYINSVLTKRHNGKPVFTWESLVNYLNRIDQYEAIPALEGLQLLSDYLTMCAQLEMQPKTDGDSLKREHDVAARLVREKADEKREQQMREAGKLTEKYNYQEQYFTVRGIRDYADLIDEAKQQHNCVASYADRITRGQSLIFVMRETDAPQKSLITIELSPKLEIRQKLLAYNKPIHNKAQSEFIERWIKHCRTTA